MRAALAPRRAGRLCALPWLRSFLLCHHRLTRIATCARRRYALLL